jgi:phospholipid/cholesterol/gamma-HCH transport system ATP-binding protein
MSGEPNKIEVRGLKKAFGPKVVLDGLDLEVGRNESLVVIGGSGTGKSVLIKNMIGILRPDGGSIKIDGEETAGVTGPARDRVSQKFGMLFQSSALFDGMSVWRNVAFRLMDGHGLSESEAKDLAIEKLAQVGLGPSIAEMSPADLSGGMQKRVGLARAIATAPEILFFDEPTTGLDPIMGDVINDLIVKCVRELGASALTITHDMSSARKIADRIAMLYKGKIIWHGPVADIDTCGNDYVDQFIHGRPEGPIQLQVSDL